MVAPHRKAEPRAREMQGRPVVPDKPRTTAPHERPAPRPLTADLSAALSRQGPEKAARVREVVRRKAARP